MTTKLVSANLGIRLTLEVDGVQKDVEWSGVCPSETLQSPAIMLSKLVEVLNTEFETSMFLAWDEVPHIKIARPAKIKAPKYVSQDEFNRRVKEIVP